jgi:cell division protease FtsH
MDEKLGHVAYEEERRAFLGGPSMPLQERTYSEETAREIDCAVRAIVKRAFDRAVDILTRERQTLERGAQLLLEKETLLEEDLQAIQAQLKEEQKVRVPERVH